MILIGHPQIAYRPFYFVKHIEEIDKTPSGSTVVFAFSEEGASLAEHCRKNGVRFAMIVDSYKEVIFANALGSAFIVVDRSLAKKAQTFANEYLCDAKILLYASDERDLEWAAEAGIDGMLFEEGIEYGSD